MQEAKDRRPEFSDKLVYLSKEVSAAKKQPKGMLCHIFFADGDVVTAKIFHSGFHICEAIGALQVSQTELCAMQLDNKQKIEETY